MVITTDGMTDTGPVPLMPAHAGLNRVMMDTVTTRATGRAVAAGSSTTIIGTTTPTITVMATAIVTTTKISIT